MSGHTPSADEVRERPTIALAREIAGWDQDAPGTTRISHWAVNLAAHLLDKGYAHAESVRAEERERIARNIEAQGITARDVPQNKDWMAVVHTRKADARVAREGA